MNTMNHEIAKKFIKMGEVKAILNNVDADGKIKNNCIALAKNDCVLLRTNGAVVYGLYDKTKQGNFGTKNKNLIQFTHDLISKDPYVKTDDYLTYKPLVLKAYREIFDEDAKTKLEAVRYIITNHKWYKEQIAKVTGTPADKTIAHKPVIDNSSAEQEAALTQTIIEKKEVNKMNRGLNIMALAHKIRIELELEGDYRAQMKMAMTYAWQINKGLKSLEDILGGSTEAADHTYNVANSTGEQESTLGHIDDREEETPVAEESSHAFEIKMHKIKDGFFQLGLTQVSTGKTKMIGKAISSPTAAAAYLYVGKNIEKIVNVLPKNTKVYALPLTISACKTRQGLKDICLSKGLTYEPMTSKSLKEIKVSANAAPSGEAV